MAAVFRDDRWGFNVMQRALVFINLSGALELVWLIPQYTRALQGFIRYYSTAIITTEIMCLVKKITELQLN